MLSLIMFSTSGCGYCPAVKQVLEEVEQNFDENELNVSYRVVDQDAESMDIAMEWGISQVPTIIAIKDREEIGRILGSITVGQLTEYVEGNIQSDVLQESPGGESEGGCPVLCDLSESENSGT